MSMKNRASSTPSAAALERRKPRYSASLKVLVFTKGLEHFQSERAANISSGGIFVCTDHICDVGEKLHIRIIFSDLDAFFDVRTRVAWVCGDDTSHPQGLGLEFVDVNDAQKQVISQFLSKYINVKEK